MNKRLILPAATAGVLGLAAAIALPLFTFKTISGVNLAVTAGFARDPHLLTASVWAPVMHACALSQACIQRWNEGLILALIALCVWLAARLRGEPAAIAAGVLIATSPLCFALLLDPLGGEVACGLMLFAVAAADLSGALHLRPVWRAAIAAAIVLQDPLYVAAVAFYAIHGVRSRAAQTNLPVIAVIAALAATLFARGRVQTPFALDAQAAPFTFIVLAVLFFVIVPALIYAGKRGFFTPVSPAGGGFAGVLILALTAAAAGAASPTGDPAPYFLAAQIALIFGALAAVRNVWRSSSATLAVTLFLAAAQLVLALRFVNHEPSVALARSSDALRAALSERRQVCMVIPPGEEPHVLAGGAFLQAYGTRGTPVRKTGAVLDCVRGNAPETHLLVIAGDAFSDYGTPGFALAKAAAGADSAVSVLKRAGRVSPDRAVPLPGGHGAFVTMIRTPLHDAAELIATAGFSDDFPCPNVARSSRLSFAAANPNPGGAPVRFTVIQHAGRTRSVLIARDLPRPSTQADPAWKFYSVPLAAGACTSIEFAAAARTSDGVAAWAAFVAPSVGPPS